MFCLNQRVEYRVDYGSMGFGTVIEVDDAAERIKVRDEDDGSVWEGSMDHADPLDNAA